QLDRIDDWNEGRATAARRYSARLADLDRVETPTEPPGAEHVYHLYVIAVPAADRDPLREHLGDAGIETGIHYPTPAYDHDPVVERLGERSLPATESVCRRIVSLPIHPRITDEEVDRVCTAVERYFEGAAA
ncbi:DegT/DnrJ/EryC1/StrS family aminotransferase, partial [Halorubrum sp. AJ67]|uniref:DegT/DnrJ/EryC1/StrS family aminotransferase n=1 Tax=Halorubrum sp. AJ67 TaxID=1173487 RepID=UPI0018969C7E